MEIKITTRQMLNFLHILSWIIFIGLCIEAGSYLFTGCYTIAFNPENATYFHLSELYSYDQGYFLVVLLLMFIVTLMKAILFYLILKLFDKKKLNMNQPFNSETGRFLFNVSYLALGTGFFSFWGIKYTSWLLKQGVQIPDVEVLHLGGADVWIFMGITLIVIAQIFKRGIEIQSENDLTI